MFRAFSSVLLFAFVASFISSTQQQKPTYIYHSCPNTTTYSQNSIYSSNLKSLLYSFSSINSFLPGGFSSTAVGRNADVVFGNFLCRGDLSGDICRECVVFAAFDTLKRCPEEKSAWILYDECILRFFDSSQKGEIILVNTQNVLSYQLDQFEDLMLSTLNEAATKAASSSRRFSATSANLTSTLSLYGLVQCTPDLTIQGCLRCLQQIINRLPTDKTGGRFIVPSCNLRYELFPFYDITTNRSRQLDSTPPPPPALPPPLTSIPSSPPGKRRNSSVIIVSVVVPIIVGFLVFVAAFILRAKKTNTIYETEPLPEDGDDITTAGSLQFDFKAIEAATNKFSENNKLGQGGFGQVYKGTFPSGVQVAVKRLSKTSGQGEREFKNEVVVVAKLQHRNLVKLLGFCLEGEEKILVYEFVPNKSLDYFLFDPIMRSQLGWTRRYKIIKGIARGILYLHQDSRLTIIHRDLKAGNILLDTDMNPKVADFGMARIFEMDQTEANTRRVVGTYGYMSPEYAMYGQFSMKSDVYSFGVLVLEIISGKKNSSLYQMNDGVCNLVTYTWRLWQNRSLLELVDPSFQDNYQKNEITSCIHIALLCVQEDVEDRPTMSTILQMLTTSLIVLAMPQPPGFFLRSRQEQVGGVGQSTDTFALCSIDDASITHLVPR